MDYDRYESRGFHCLEIAVDEVYILYCLALDRVGCTDKFGRLRIVIYYDSGKAVRTEVFFGIGKMEVVLIWH